MSRRFSLRSRLLAVALLLASPGAGGMLLPILHPCPVDQPWVTGHRMGPAAEHAHHHPADGSGPQHQHCQCIGACEDVAVSGSDSPLAAIRFPLPVVRVIGSDAARPARWSDPANLLPPSTAPPLV